MSRTDEVRMILTATLTVLVALKLTGVLAWSWLWVLAPFWVPALVALAALVGMFAWVKFRRP